ncbi:MAG TPA: amidohydrolase [Ktedonobacterales bacterium]
MPEDTLHADVERMRPELVTLRRHFHQHPELSFEETETAKEIAARLRELGIETREGVGGTGIVGLIQGEKPGPTLLVRADIDALPIEELSETEYRSQTPGKMHACGHDGHIAIGLGLAELLMARRGELAGAVKLVFQPAEERAAGAEAMINDGVLRDPVPDACLGLHLWSSGRVGTVSLQSGPIMASADEIIIHVRGKGGHGAMPHEAVDPIIIAAHIITALQTLVSREVSPFAPVVLTIGSIHGGSAFNVIADEVEIKGTLRTYDEALRAHLKERIASLAGGIAVSMRGEARCSVGAGTGPCVNDAGMTALVRSAVVATLGEKGLPEGDARVTPSDDMSAFLAAAPGCYFFVGAGNSERGITAPHHNARFDIDEESLPIGLEIMARATLAYLAKREP